MVIRQNGYIFCLVQEIKFKWYLESRANLLLFSPVFTSAHFFCLTVGKRLEMTYQTTTQALAVSVCRWRPFGWDQPAGEMAPVDWPTQQIGVVPEHARQRVQFIIGQTVCRRFEQNWR